MNNRLYTQYTTMTLQCRTDTNDNSINNKGSYGTPKSITTLFVILTNTTTNCAISVLTSKERELH